MTLGVGRPSRAVAEIIRRRAVDMTAPRAWEWEAHAAHTASLAPLYALVGALQSAEAEAEYGHHTWSSEGLDELIAAVEAGGNTAVLAKEFIERCWTIG